MSDLLAELDLARPAMRPLPLGQLDAARAWTWPRHSQPSVWMPQNVYVPGSATSRPGRYSFSGRPTWKPIVDWAVEPGRLVAAIISPSQSGKSVNMAGLTGWGASTRPGTIMWYRETEPKVKEFVENVLIPIYRNSPSLARLLHSNSREALRKTGLRFDSGGALITDTVGGKSSMVSRSPWMVVLDELDKCYDSNKGISGDLVEAATKRVLTHRSLGHVICPSTPTLDDKGIWLLWLKSQQWEWCIPCPDCGVIESLSFFGRTEDGQFVIDNTGIDKSLLHGGVRWPRLEDGSHPDPDRLMESNGAWYECPHCGFRTHDQDRANLVRSGSLTCITPERSPLYSAVHQTAMLFPEYSFSRCAAEFLKARHSPALMVNFRNDVLALPRTTKKQKAIEVSTLEMLRSSTWSQGSGGPRDIGPIPSWVQRVYFAADAQKVEFWGVLEGVGYEGESQVLWAGRIDSKRDIQDLDTHIWRRQDGAFLSLNRGGIDTGDGNRTHELYYMISRLSNFVALKGNSRLDKPMVLSNQDIRSPDGSVAVEGIVLYSWNTTHFQDQLQNQIDLGAGVGAGALHLPSDCPREWFVHIRGEHRVEELVKGIPKWVWKPVYASAPNHLRDAHGMCKVLAHLDGWSNEPRPIPVTGAEQADYLSLISGRIGS